MSAGGSLIVVQQEEGRPERFAVLRLFHPGPVANARAEARRSWLDCGGESRTEDLLQLDVEGRLVSSAAACRERLGVLRWSRGDAQPTSPRPRRLAVLIRQPAACSATPRRPWLGRRTVPAVSTRRFCAMGETGCCIGRATRAPGVWGRCFCCWCCWREGKVGVGSGHARRAVSERKLIAFC